MKIIYFTKFYEKVGVENNIRVKKNLSWNFILKSTFLIKFSVCATHLVIICINCVLLQNLNRKTIEINASAKIVT